MPNLYDRSPAAGLVPVEIGRVTLDERLPGRVTSVAPFAGREKKLAKALDKLGLGWPETGRAVSGAVAECLWTGRDQAFLVGIVPDKLAGLAALTDQSDAWVVLTLEGPGAGDVLARLTPLDLRAQAFPIGASLRSQLGHMQAILRHCAPDAFEVWVFRSMAATAVHELAQVMRSLAARAALATTSAD